MGKSVPSSLLRSRPAAKEPLRTRAVPQRSHQKPLRPSVALNDPMLRTRSGARSTAGGEARQVSAMSPDHLPRLQPGRKTVMGDRVLVVDDDLSILRVVAANLRARGYEALTAASGTVALTVIETAARLHRARPRPARHRWPGGPSPPPHLDNDAGRDPHRRRRRARQGHGVGSWCRRLRHQAVRDGRAAGQGSRALRHGQSSQNLNQPRRIQTGPVCIDLDAGAVTRWGQPYD